MTIGKAPFAKFSQVGGQGDQAEAIAPLERPELNHGDAVWEFDGGEIVAVGERIILDDLQARGEFDRLELVITFKEALGNRS